MKPTNPVESLVTVKLPLPRGQRMKPTSPVDLLASAIATEEGFFVPGTIPAIRHNPGDIAYAGQIGAHFTSELPGVAVCDSDAAGITILFRQLWLQVAEGQTVREIIAQWAPPSENNTSQYLENVLTWTGLPADTPVLELLPPLQKLD